MFVKVTKRGNEFLWYKDFIDGIFAVVEKCHNKYIVLHNGERGYGILPNHCVECDIRGNEILETESYLPNPLNRQFTFCYLEGNTIKHITVDAGDLITACEKTNLPAESVFSIVRH